MVVSHDFGGGGEPVRDPTGRDTLLPARRQTDAVSPTVELGDGVRIETTVGTVVADASSPDGDVAICSHAHTDHLPRADAGPIACSQLTADLAAVRSSVTLDPAEHDAVDLRPSGHVAGSRAAVVDDGDARVLFTGDVCTRDRCYLDGFEPVEADVLVVEATYGSPEYTFPSPDEVERRVLEWLDADLDRPVICVGYALGRAQKLQHLVGRSERDRCLVTEPIAAVNEPIEDALGLAFGAEVPDTVEDVSPGDAVVLSAGAARSGLLDDLRTHHDALVAGFSGWAIDRSYRFRRGFDAAFPLTDHCDFEELLALVEAVDPETVYTHHGFADEFAGALSLRGYDARSLEREQASLSDF